MDFSSKSIVHIDHFTFGEVNSIKSINLSNNSISIVSQAFNQYLFRMIFVSQHWDTSNHFYYLLHLNLSHNKIIHIDMDSLLGAFCKTLDLSYNKLTKLTSNQLFTKWSSYPNPIKIETLYLNNNELNDISSLFSYSSSHYPRLAHVYLEFNSLTRIDSSTFANVKSLTHLYLNENQIKSIDSLTFQGLTNLRQVYLYNNPVSNYASVTPQLLQLLQLCGPANTNCSVCFSASCSSYFNI